MAEVSRDQALSQLETAFREYLTSEKSRIENEVSFLKAVVEGTTGSSRLRSRTKQKAGVLLLDEVEAFLRR